MAPLLAVPSFARSASDTALEEYRAFLESVGADGAMLLAEFCEMGGKREVAQRDRSATSGLWIRYMADWAVFYAVRTQPFRITVLHVARYRTASGGPDAFLKAQREALERLSSLER